MSDVEEDTKDPQNGGDEKQPKEKQPLVRLEQAPSGRSTCKTTQEKIDKGEWRVGMEAWAGGRVSTVWHKLVPFLQHCTAEVCSRGNAGKCKHTGHAFKKGDSRFILFATASGKSYLTIAAAGEVLKPLIDQAGDDFKLVDLKGLAELPAEVRQEYAQAFSVPDAEMAAFNDAHPAPDPASEEPKPKKRKVASPKSPKPAAEGKASPAKAASAKKPAAGTSKSFTEAAAAGQQPAEPAEAAAAEPAEEPAAEDSAEQPAEQPAKKRARKPAQPKPKPAAKAKPAAEPKPEEEAAEEEPAKPAAKPAAKRKAAAKKPGKQGKAEPEKVEVLEAAEQPPKKRAQRKKA